MCDKVKVKDSASRTMEGFLDLESDEITLEIVGVDEPQPLRELLKRFGNEYVSLKIDYKSQLTADEVVLESVEDATGTGN